MGHVIVVRIEGLENDLIDKFHPFYISALRSRSKKQTRIKSSKKKKIEEIKSEYEEAASHAEPFAHITCQYWKCKNLSSMKLKNTWLTMTPHPFTVASEYFFLYKPSVLVIHNDQLAHSHENYVDNLHKVDKELGDFLMNIMESKSYKRTVVLLSFKQKSSRYIIMLKHRKSQCTLQTIAKSYRYI